jgi:hypothetical protein
VEVPCLYIGKGQSPDDRSRFELVALGWRVIPDLPVAVHAPAEPLALKRDTTAVVIAGADFAEMTPSSRSRRDETLDMSAVAQLTEAIPTPAVHEVTHGNRAGVVASSRDLAEAEIAGYSGGLRTIDSGTIPELALVVPSPAIERVSGDGDPAGEPPTYAHATEQFVTWDRDGSSIRPVAPAVRSIIWRDRTGRAELRADLVEWNRRQRRGD